jgi:molybdopterin-guanine dinucleotide biosynthesis protein A
MGISVSIAILSGGASSRFGGLDKQELLFRGTMLGTRVAEQALSTGSPVTVVGRNPTPYGSLPVSFTVDSIPGYGPLSGLHAALRETTCDYVYLLACDMPFFSSAWYEKLLLSARVDPGLDAIAAFGPGGLEPFHALYSRRLVPLLESRFIAASRLGKRLSFARAIEGSARLFIPEDETERLTQGGKIFLGINTPEEARRLEESACLDSLSFLRRH